jgi:NADH-quinone oxidoreductase subunit E
MQVFEIEPAVLPEAVTGFVSRQRSRYPNARALLIPTLMEVQKYYGWISPEAAMGVSKLLDVPYGEVQSCISFYTMLQTKPTGKYIVGICRTLNCELEGALDLIHHFEHRFGVEPMEVTADGNFMMYEVECLCDCHNAPSIQWLKNGAGAKGASGDFTPYWVNNVSIELFDRILDELSGKVPVPAGFDPLAERLVRLTPKENAPDNRRWAWLVTTMHQYPVVIEEKNGEQVPMDGYGKLEGLKERNPHLWKEIQEALKK